MSSEAVSLRRGSSVFRRVPLGYGPRSASRENIVREQAIVSPMVFNLVNMRNAGAEEMHVFLSYEQASLFSGSGVNSDMCGAIVSRREALRTGKPLTLEDRSNIIWICNEAGALLPGFVTAAELRTIARSAKVEMADAMKIRFTVNKRKLEVAEGLADSEVLLNETLRSQAFEALSALPAAAFPPMLLDVDARGELIFCRNKRGGTITIKVTSSRNAYAALLTPKKYEGRDGFRLAVEIITNTSEGRIRISEIERDMPANILDLSYVDLTKPAPQAAIAEGQKPASGQRSAVPRAIELRMAREVAAWIKDEGGIPEDGIEFFRQSTPQKGLLFVSVDGIRVSMPHSDKVKLKSADGFLVRARNSESGEKLVIVQTKEGIELTRFLLRYNGHMLLFREII